MNTHGTGSGHCDRSAPSLSGQPPWWQGAVVYQIYPRSFYDASNDGTGDLAGIIARLDYVRRLGVDAFWLSPIFRSPMADFGYDISDYRDIDPVFGTMADFEALVAAAHALGLKVIIDQVYSHTSHEHPWFQESRRNRHNTRADWYVWANPRPDGTPPNNWLSLFGGPAWTWDAARRQYYLHNFLSEQPDLNFHNAGVRSAILDIARFWLDKSVDGLRLDVANFYYCDAALRDNPPSGDTEATRPYQYQRHLYDRSLPENLKFAEQLRQLTDSYPKRMMVAEIGSQSYVARSMEYTQGPKRIHTAYNFQLLETGPLSASLIRDTLESWTSDAAWPSWSFSNHDVERVATRWGGDSASVEFPRMLVCLLMCLRGTIFLYQGEELGLPQARVARADLRDPEGIRFWPHNLGRDGARTPFPWRHDAPHAGFSNVPPWLPSDPAHAALAVDTQQHDSGSVLNAVRRAIAARRSSAALRLGGIRFEDAPEPVLRFRRTHGREVVHCVFNLGAEPTRTTIADSPGERLLGNAQDARLVGRELSLPGFGFAVWRQADLLMSEGREVGKSSESAQ